MKKIIVSVVILLFLIFGTFILLNQSRDTDKEQLVLEQTNNISRDYIALRYQTDNILINAESYSSYDAWNKDMTALILSWETLEERAVSLELSAAEISAEKVSLKLIAPVLAYDNQEISNVFDKAPAGKKIVTLAKYLGVDAQKAYQILKNDQAQVEADAWNEAGDTFQKLETSAVVIKDAAKVTGFVGTIVMTGGTSAIASSGIIGQAAVVVSGADLVLEITDDSAKIALGNNNKISAIAGDVRVVSEPLSSLLMISTLPNNLVKGIDKLNAVSFALDQFNSAVQEGKVIGIKLPTPKEQANQSAKAAVLDKSELEQWLKDQGIDNNSESVEEIESILMIKKEDDSSKDDENNIIEEAEDLDRDVSGVSMGDEDIVGRWTGVLKYTPSQSEGERQLNYELNLKMME
ncbi:MAG: hypothetical protein PHW82_17465 [Bacteroidales bacterium]|nr:hypothetical protein [Bacteroidales bacterium]